MIELLKEKWNDFNFIIKIARWNQPMEVNITALLILPGIIGLYLIKPSLVNNWPKAVIIFFSILTCIYLGFSSICIIEGMLLAKRINKFYISVPTLFSNKYRYLNLKKPKRKIKKTQCPKLISLLNMRELELKENITYIACTHDGIINFLKDNKKYNVEFLQEPKLLTTKSLHKVVKKLKNKKCKQCERNYKNKKICDTKVCDWIKKEEREFYGIKFKIIKKM